MTVPSMFSMNRAVAMMRAVRTAERMDGFRVGAFMAPGRRDRKAGHGSPGSQWVEGAPSAAEHHLVHDPPGREREQAGDDKGKGEYPDHGLTMAANVVLASAPDRDRNRRQREQRQEMDRAPRSPHADRMDEE